MPVVDLTGSLALSVTPSAAVLGQVANVTGSMAWVVGLKEVRPPVSGSMAVSLGFSATQLTNDVQLEPWEVEKSQKFTIGVRLFGDLELNRPVVSPPVGFRALGPGTGRHINVKRVSLNWPAPTLNPMGLPRDWEVAATGNTIEEWGRLRILCNGEDVTYYRDVLTQIEEWESGEPFDDSVCVIRFPQVSEFEALPAWLVDGADIRISVVKPSGVEKILWQGIKLSDEPATIGIIVHGIGTFYQADFFVQPAPLAPPVVAKDIGHLIGDNLNRAVRPSYRFLPPERVTTGITTVKGGDWGTVLTNFIAELLAIATTDAGEQWTVMREGDLKKPQLRLKDRTTVHWTMRFGQDGLVCNVARDIRMAPNAIYGEGIDNKNCRWRNSKYPNLRADPAPVFSGTLMSPGASYPDMILFEREVIPKGYPFDEDGYYALTEEKFVREIQREAGILEDGIIGPQTWAAAFEVGSNAGDLSAAFYRPLWQRSAVEPYIYNADGSIIGDNPSFDRTVLRVERFENFGSRIEKGLAAKSARQEIARDYPASYAGDCTLTADPLEGSRFEVKAGQNIKILGHRGVDRLFHIARCRVNWTGGSVHITVDEKARDVLTLREILQRNLDATDPARTRDRWLKRSSRTVEDRIATFDCENGAGIVPRHGVYQGLWNVLRIPVGEVGRIVKTEFKSDSPVTRFSVAVFDRAITANELDQLIPGGPISGDVNPWPDFPENKGLIIAWGQPDQAMGYWPKSESEGGSVTGTFVDTASWDYYSSRPPWLWIGIYSDVTTYIRGKLTHGVA